MFETILVEVTAKHVGIVTLNRPEQLNTFTSQMAGELHAALLAMEADDKVQDGHSVPESMSTNLPVNRQSSTENGSSGWKILW
jgi:hypothetical protein